jgi:hypothetical protein
MAEIAEPHEEREQVPTSPNRESPQGPEMQPSAAPRSEHPHTRLALVNTDVTLPASNLGTTCGGFMIDISDEAWSTIR